MADWKKICVAVDFSEPSRFAMVSAAELARGIQADLTVAHVYQAPDEVSITPELTENAKGEVAGMLESWRSEAERIASRPVRSMTLLGHPAAELLRFGERESFDLLVLATHGRTGLKHLVLGSVAERVVREARCPVLVERRKA